MLIDYFRPIDPNFSRKFFGKNFTRVSHEFFTCVSRNVLVETYMNFSFLETRPLIVVLFMLVGSFLFKNAWFTKMSEGDKVPKDVKGDLRSVLISSNGVKESRVEKDYHELSGKKLMWKNYGFKSLNAFLSALPDVCVIQYSAKDRENRVYGVQLEGTFMSSHAKKNSKVASTGISPVKQQIVPESGRLVEKDGSSFKITLSNLDQKASVSDEGTDDLKPNANGLFQVYISKLPESCSEVNMCTVARLLNVFFWWSVLNINRFVKNQVVVILQE